SSVGHRVTGRRTGYCSSQGAGWEFVHVAIDDHSRIARAEIFSDQKKESAVAFLVATVAYFRSLGITVERVMTDNGSCYLSKAFARACKQLAVKHGEREPLVRRALGGKNLDRHDERDHHDDQEPTHYFGTACHLSPNEPGIVIGGAGSGAGIFSGIFG